MNLILFFLFSLASALYLVSPQNLDSTDDLALHNEVQEHSSSSRFNKWFCKRVFLGARGVSISAGGARGGGGGSAGARGGGSSGGSTKGGGSYKGGGGGSTKGKDPSGSAPASNVKGYGNKSPDYSQNYDPPPPYSAAGSNKGSGSNAKTLPPYDSGRSYGQRGPTKSYWNGQYYPYRSFGYGGSFPMGYGAVPFLFAGPFGFYGHYSPRGDHSNSTTRSMYINGTQDQEDGNLYNGTYVRVEWENGEYRIHQCYGGAYHMYSWADSNVAVNGTFWGTGQCVQDKVINPNVTANGTELPQNESANKAP